MKAILAMALASAWSVAAQAQRADQIVLTSPDIQTGAPVPLLAFTGTAARTGLANVDGAHLCGLNKIVKQIDSTSLSFSLRSSTGCRYLQPA